jgi:hypothetical protein
LGERSGQQLVAWGLVFILMFGVDCFGLLFFKTDRFTNAGYEMDAIRHGDKD